MQNQSCLDVWLDFAKFPHAMCDIVMWLELDVLSSMFNVTTATYIFKHIDIHMKCGFCLCWFFHSSCLVHHQFFSFTPPFTHHQFPGPFQPPVTLFSHAGLQLAWWKSVEWACGEFPFMSCLLTFLFLFSHVGPSAFAGNAGCGFRGIAVVIQWLKKLSQYLHVFH